MVGLGPTGMHLGGLTLACAVFWLPAPATARAQTPSTETCPPVASTPGTNSAPNTPTAANPLQPTSGQIVACVGSEPINGSLLRHWAIVAELAEGPSHKQSASKTHALIGEVMGFLISSSWVIGEARDLKVHLSTARVRSVFDRTRREQFPKRGEFKAFLRSTGQTVADLLFRVRLNLLSTRIQRLVIAGHRTPDDQQQALKRFVQAFKDKWRAQTYCSPTYAVADCGHVQILL